MGRAAKQPVYVDDNGTRTFVCSKCGFPKVEFDFYQNRNTKAGLSSWCKSCMGDYNASHPHTTTNERLDALEARLDRLEALLDARNATE
jgi:hypothetical protein